MFAPPPIYVEPLPEEPEIKIDADDIQQMFNEELYLEILTAVKEIDMKTISNFSISLGGTLSKVMSRKDNNGNVLLHLALMIV